MEIVKNLFSLSFFIFKQVYAWWSSQFKFAWITENDCQKYSSRECPFINQVLVPFKLPENLLFFPHTLCFYTHILKDTHKRNINIFSDSFLYFLYTSHLAYVKNNKRNTIINFLFHLLGILLGRIQTESSYSIKSIGELNIILQVLDKWPSKKKGYICLHFVQFANVLVQCCLFFFLHELLMNHCEQTKEKGNKTCKIKPLDFFPGLARIQLGELKRLGTRTWR